MFWGLVLEPGKRYSTTVEKSFHVSMATLDCSSIKADSEILSVVLETEGSESLLCNLCKQKGILQNSLDLNFMTGDRLTFECRGHGRIHLSGYLLTDDDDDLSNMIEDEESEDDDNEAPILTSLDKPKKDKRKNESLTTGGNLAKKKKIAADADDDSEKDSSEDDDSDLSEGINDEGDDEDAGMDEEEEDDDDDDESDEEEEKLPTPPKKTPNKQPQTPKTPVTNGVTPKEQKSNKKTPGGGDKSANTSPKQRIALDKGVIVKDVRVGNGTPAKAGKMVAVSYIGKLKDGKVFDKTNKGGEFKFRLGKGEVIKGWDIGVQGMRVGGRRVITCPPEVAYGSKGAAPKIPPNSTLSFEVELKKVF